MFNGFDPQQIQKLQEEYLKKLTPEQQEEVAKQMQTLQANQHKIAMMKEQIDAIEVDAESGAGLVSITMKGTGKVSKLFVDESLLDEDKEVLEEMVISAFNSGIEKLEKAKLEKAMQISKSAS